MPRPAYIAAHRPAGPAPTMITSFINPRPPSAAPVAAPRLHPRAPVPAAHGTARFRTPRRTAGRRPAFPALPRPPPPRRVGSPGADATGRRPPGSAPAKRVPHRGFHRLVGGPIVAGVEQVTGARDGRLTLIGNHGRQRAAEGGRGCTGATTAAPCRPLPPLPPRSAAGSPPRGTS